MRLLLFLIILFIECNTISFAQNRAAMKEAIKNLLTEQNLSGAVWATVSDQGEIVTDAYGYKHIKSKVLLSPTDKVHVGSVSKTILAAGLFRMATLGLIHLDDPVKKILPDLPIKNPWESTHPVSIRHLIDHTAGITDAKLWHIFSTTATPDTPLETVYLNSPGILQVQVRPGTLYSYSNLGYSILGMVIEKITQQRYETYLDDKLLGPLEMHHSSFQFISQDQDQQLAFGHFENGEAVVALPMYLRPAGQFTTTAADMGKFLRFLLSDGTLKGQPFIDSTYLASVGHQQFTYAFKNGVPYGEASGAYSRDRYGVTGIAKNGNILGFSSMIYLFPHQRKAFFIAHNMDSETANYDLYNEAIVNHLGLTRQPFITHSQNTETELSKWKGYYVPVITKVEPFGLLDHVFSSTQVKITKTGALYKPFQGKEKTLLYQGNYLFSMNDRTDISHSFYTSPDGGLFITDGVKTIRKVSGLKILAIAVSLLLGLCGLLYLLISGCVQLVKLKGNFSKHPEFWAFIPVLTMLISFVFIVTQPFMRMGDRTIGNILLATSTALIPVGTFVSFLFSLTKQRRFLYSFTSWALIFVLQFCVLLLSHQLLPIIMWK